MRHSKDNLGLLLVSKSPRRRRLIEWLGLPYEVAEVDVDESIKQRTDTLSQVELENVVAEIARRKAVAVRELPKVAERVILTFDTLVSFEGEMLGKPRDEADARSTLARLSGRDHQVITGFAVWFPDEDAPRVEAVTTNVTMRDLSQQDIDEWIAQGEYTGCAGSYNIEAQVASVAPDECFQNVVGLPLCHLHHALSHALSQADSLVPPRETCDHSLSRICKLRIS